MFDFITDSIENGLDILGGLVEGETPSKHQIAKLIADGVSIYSIAEVTGHSVDVIQSLVDDT